jgi:hypothetical protein
MLSKEVYRMGKDVDKFSIRMFARFLTHYSPPLHYLCSMQVEGKQIMDLVKISFIPLHKKFNTVEGNLVRGAGLTPPTSQLI